MDPLTIATTATGIVKSCYQVTATVYTFIDDSRNIDTNVDDLLREIQGLSRAAESISSAWSQNPMIITAQAGQQRNLWGSVGTSLEDCQITLARLNSKLDELKKGSSFARGFLRKPTKLIMLNMRLKDIVSFKQQIQSYNSAMQGALLMINVCLSLNSNSSQESVAQILGGLKNQIGHLRMETTRQGQLISGFTSPELAKDNERMTQNLRSLIQEAEALHSSASTVVSDSRSTVWDGSVLGDPLSDEQYNSIRNWIPPLAISEEEPKTAPPPQSGSSFLDSAIGEESSLDQDSDADFEIERDLMKRYREVALTSFEQKDYVKAESFLLKVIEMSADVNSSEDEMKEINLMLAFSCGLQNKWEEAEIIFLPIAMTKSTTDFRSFHGLHALALFHLTKSNHEIAIKYCKRAIGGFGKLLGKTSMEYYNSMKLLAQIFDLKCDPTSAEGCRTFLPSHYNEKLEMDPQLYLSSTLSKIQQPRTFLPPSSSTTILPIRTAVVNAQNVDLQTLHQNRRAHSVIYAEKTTTETLRLWGKRSTLTGHLGFVWSVVFSPDGRLVASASGDGTVRLWGVASGVARSTLSGHTGPVWSVVFSPDGRLLASASDDGTVRLWIVALGAVCSMLTGHTNQVREVVFSPDGRLVASASADKTVRLWNSSSGAVQYILTGHTDSIWSVVFSPDGKLVASASGDGTVRLWDAALGETCSTLTDHTGSILSVVFSPDSRLVASASVDKTVRLWDAASGEALSTLTGHTGPVSSIVFSPDGKLLASASDDNTVRLWDTASGAVCSMLAGHNSSIWSIVFSADGKLLASASDDKTVRLWDAASGEALSTLTGHTSTVWNVVFSPDGKLLASAGADNTLLLWEEKKILPPPRLPP